jgi:Uma2 family endonuclease
MTETKVKVRTEYHPIVLHTHPVLDLDEEQFFRFCQQHKDLRIERTAEGDLEVMPPAGWETAHRNMKLAFQLGTWAEQDSTGIATDSSGGFKLPTARCGLQTPLGYGANGWRVSRRSRSRGSFHSVQTS